MYIYTYGRSLTLFYVDTHSFFTGRFIESDIVLLTIRQPNYTGMTYTNFEPKTS